MICTATASADTFSTEVGGRAVRANADAMQVQGVAYVPVSALVRQWGGNAGVQAVSAELSLNGRGASLGINAAQVSVGGRQFALSYPALRRDNEVYVAADDLAGLMGTAFGLRVQQAPSAPTAPAVPPPKPTLNAATPADDTVPAVPAPPRKTVPPATALAPAVPPPLPLPAAPSQGVPPQSTTAPAVAEPPLMAPMQTTPATAATPAEPKADENPAGTPAFDVIAIDAGHGGSDAGMAGPGGDKESQIALLIAQKLRAALQAHAGWRVVMTREEDRETSTRERAGIAQKAAADLVVSIHLGASFAPQAAGIDVFYAGVPPAQGLRGQVVAAGRDYSAVSQRFAEAIGGEAAKAAGAPLRGVHAGELRLLRAAGRPGVLVEAGFLSNSAEAGLLANPSYQEKLANGIARGIAAAAQEAKAP